MQKSEALAHYNNSQAELAKACGITRSAVHQWPALIPELAAVHLDRITGGKLRYDPAVYARHKKTPYVKSVSTVRP
jgi:transcriptional regulator with XRE-family HTH domain